MNATLYDPLRTRRKPRKRPVQATMRDPFASGVPLGTVRFWPVTVSAYLVYRLPLCKFSRN